MKLREKNKITQSAQLADGRAGSHRPPDTKAGLFFFFFKHHTAPQVDVSKVAPRKNGALRTAVHG